jgi:hypothetical protein
VFRAYSAPGGGSQPPSPSTSSRVASPAAPGVRARGFRGALPRRGWGPNPRVLFAPLDCRAASRAREGVCGHERRIGRERWRGRRRLAREQACRREGIGVRGRPYGHSVTPGLARGARRLPAPVRGGRLGVIGSQGRIRRPPRRDRWHSDAHPLASAGSGAASQRIEDPLNRTRGLAVETLQSGSFRRPWHH